MARATSHQKPVKAGAKAGDGRYGPTAAPSTRRSRGGTAAPRRPTRTARIPSPPNPC